jgi:hypothetical protein
MSDFQVTIVPGQDAGKKKTGKKESFAIRQHSRGGKIIQGIEDLSGVWDQVIEKLTDLASQSKAAAAASSYDLSSIEFNIGIEAGLSIGLVTKGNASVKVVFKKKEGPAKKS